MNQVTGRLIAVHEADAGPTGTIDVRGARVRVPLLLIPEAVIGDTLLLEAGVALAILERAPSPPQHGRND